MQSITSIIWGIQTDFTKKLHEATGLFIVNSPPAMHFFGLYSCHPQRCLKFCIIQLFRVGEVKRHELKETSKAV